MTDSTPTPRSTKELLCLRTNRQFHVGPPNLFIIDFVSNLPYLDDTNHILRCFHDSGVTTRDDIVAIIIHRKEGLSHLQDHGLTLLEWVILRHQLLFTLSLQEFQDAGYHYHTMESLTSSAWGAMDSWSIRAVRTVVKVGLRNHDFHMLASHEKDWKGVKGYLSSYGFPLDEQCKLDKYVKSFRT